jgi:hypothetical protein
MVVAARSEALLVLVFLTEGWAWEWICLLPWVAWGWKGAGVVWPRLGKHPVYRGVGRIWEAAGRMGLLGLAGLWVSQHVGAAGEICWWSLPLGAGMQRVEEPYVAVEKEDGVCCVDLAGVFKLYIRETSRVQVRMLIIFLGLLEVEGETRGSRRTRDPYVPTMMAQLCSVV